MKILKTFQRIEDLAARANESERQELQRREELMLRLVKSKNNSLKLFSLKPKGENFC